MSAAKKAAMLDPAKRARVAKAGTKNLRAWHADNDFDWRAFHLERAAKRRAADPVGQSPQYLQLRNKVGAPEARRIIEAEIPGTLEHARRCIANRMLAQRLRRERERREAY